ncbi:hypothetical protein D3C72_120030 [compost metagenome]
MNVNARTNPITGLKSRDSTIREIPLSCRACQPWPAKPAPMTPPIKACDELEGMPHHQVRRFQAIAESKAAITSQLVANCGSTIPLPIVAATLVLVIAPARFITAASMIALRGLRTPVETEAAMALAVSWNPLM